MTDPVTRLNAALEGRYRVKREIGEGGMATVYLAQDLKHERSVALKVLKPDLAAVVGADRFLAEIRTTANLQHPHILPLFDSGEADGFLFYVMPYVEGESLRERLDREHQLPVEEALGIATNVAEALEYAHSHGVVHRDIKPANILLQSGKPVVSDFGIALAVGVAGAGRLTETGLSLGTPHYMSPEQATGDRDIGPRADIYSLACVLYEMLAGDPPFAASTAQAVLAKILTTDAPSITVTRRTVPPNVSGALTRALEKLPADRFASAADFLAALGDESFTYRARRRTAEGAPDPVAEAVAERAWLRNPRSVAALVALVALAGLSAWAFTRGGGPAGQALRLSLDVGDEAVPYTLGDVVIAPDGSAFAFDGETGGIYARRAGEERFRFIEGTENGFYPSFSPDGEWIVFRDRRVTTSEEPLLKVSLDGGSPLTVLPAGLITNANVPHWGDDGTIVFRSNDGLFRIDENGGEPELLIDGASWAWFPRLLPGGRGVLFTDSRSYSIGVLDLETDSVLTLIPEGTDASYVTTGHIIYAHPGGGLFAAPFDLASLEVGVSRPVLEDISLFATGGNTLRASYSVSLDGTLVYSVGGPVAEGAGAGEELVIIDLEGNRRPIVFDPRDIENLRWSPDGESVVYSSLVEGQANRRDIYLYDVVRGTTPRPLTFEGDNDFPVFSPDGARVAFSSQREDTDGFDVWAKALGDDSPARSLATLPGDEVDSQWFADDTIAYEQAPTPSDLWILDLSDPNDVQARVYLPSEADLDAIRVSPDGTLAAYVSDETGLDEVYARSFPVPGERTPVSDGGGQFPFWAPDGGTVYYWGTAVTSLAQYPFVAARLERDPTRVLQRDTLFIGPFGSRSDWALHPDGDRLIVPLEGGSSTEEEETEPRRFIVVLNWFEELLERMGER